MILALMMTSVIEVMVIRLELKNVYDQIFFLFKKYALVIYQVRMMKIHSFC